MTQRVGAHMSISLDGFGTGRNQRLEKPFGDGEAGNLHRWLFEDRENNQDERKAVTAYGAATCSGRAGVRGTLPGRVGGAPTRHTTLRYSF
ncbi:MAG: dihydrofolate reductase [Hyphomicrobiales bacterium]|nr:dihydrofolate reductase [Hyphomicrobiales bacterium]